MSIFPFSSQTWLPAQILSRQLSAAPLGFTEPSLFFIHHNKRQTQRDGCPQQDGALISVHREAPSDSFISPSATCCRLATNVPYNHNWSSQSPSRLGLGQMACSTVKSVPKFDPDKRTSGLPFRVFSFFHTFVLLVRMQLNRVKSHTILSQWCFMTLEWLACANKIKRVRHRAASPPTLASINAKPFLTKALAPEPGMGR